jgi:hypothetical protein
MNGGEQIKLFDKFEVDINNSTIVIYPSIFIQTVKSEYDSNGQLLDILYLVCMRGDIHPKMSPSDSFNVELELNPIIVDLFEILLERKHQKKLKKDNLKNDKRKKFSDNLTADEFFKIINIKLAKKLKVYKRFVFGNEEYAQEMKNVNLTSNKIKEMEELEKASLDLFYITSTTLAKAFELLHQKYKNNKDSYSLNKLLESQQKIDIIKSFFIPSPDPKSMKKTLKRSREPNTYGFNLNLNTTPNKKNPKIKPNTVNTVLLNRTRNKNKSNRTQINNSEPPPSPQF